MRTSRFPLSWFLSITLMMLVLSACPQKNAPSSATSFQLDNGLQVTLQPVNEAPTSCVLLLFDVGEAHDPDDQSGLAHLVEHLFVTAATSSTKARTVEDIKTAYPVGWNAQTGNDYTVVAYLVANDQVASEVQDAAARLGDLHVTDADLEREKGRMRTELSNMYERIPMLAVRNVATELVAPSPSGGQHGGVPEQVDSITLDDIRQRLQDVYKPRNAHLVVVGGFDMAAVRKEIEDSFSSIRSGSAPQQPKRSLETRTGEIVTLDTAIAPGVMSVAVAAPSISSDDYPAFSVLAIRLLRETQIRRGQAVTNSVGYTPLDRPEVLTLTRVMDEGETQDEATNRLGKQMTDIVAKPITQADRTSAKEFARLLGVDGYPELMTRGNPYGVAFSTARTKQLGFDAKGYSAAVDALNEDDMESVRTKYFAAGKRGIAVIPPPAK